MTDPNASQPGTPQTPVAPPPASQGGWQHPAPGGQIANYPPTPTPMRVNHQQATFQTWQPGLAQQQPAGYALPQAPLVRKQGAWGLWWLVIITFGIYYYLWYARINRELSALLRHDVPADGQWWCQLIPIYNLVGLARTAKRLNAAHAAVGSPTRVGVFTTWFWAPSWFASQTRYLQRRLNILHDVLASHSVR